MDEAQIPPDSDIPWKQIGAPASRALTEAGFTRLEQLAQVGVKPVLALHGVGPKAIRILREVMAAKGMEFKQGFEKYEKH